MLLEISWASVIYSLCIWKAATAGNLSVKQFKLAFELGDTGLEYRCRLYYSLSMIQRGQLQQAKKIVR